MGRSSKNWLILDNGAAEAVTFGSKHLLTIADFMHADEVVVPDTLFEMRETIGQATAFGQVADPRFRYMGVLQGTNWGEFLTCFKAYLEMPILNYITTIGVPRLMNTFDPNMRIKFMEWININGYDATLEFHCLGASPFHLDEAKQLSKNSSVRGIDTSAPIYLGLEGITLEEAKNVGRPEDFFERTTIDNEVLIMKNIAQYLEWAQYEYSPPSS